MAKDCSQPFLPPPGGGSDNLSMVLTARITLFLVCAMGLVCVIRAVLGADLEWRVFAMVALAFALGPLTAEVHGCGAGGSIRFPVAHPVLFGGALALGPAGAALPAAFSGISRLLAAPTPHVPVYRALYVAMKPAVVCAAASLAYTAAGGSVLRPQGSDSLLPLVCAAASYLAVGMLLAAAVESHDRKGVKPLPPKPVLAAGWSLCFLAGYSLAVLYAVAPAYVLLAPAAAAALAGTALRRIPEEHRKPKAPEAAVEEPPVEAEYAPGAAEQAEADVSFVDVPTGLANRRYLEMFLGRELGRAERTGKPVSAAVFDVEGFGRLTETAGQEAVNAALGEVAARLTGGVRDYDVVARYSAGRVIVVLPETPAEQALEVTERLHSSLASISIAGEPICVSAGLATYPEHGTTSDDLINSAHHALNRGRFDRPNSVCSYHDLRRAS